MKFKSCQDIGWCKMQVKFLQVTAKAKGSYAAQRNSVVYEILRAASVLTCNMSK